MSLGVGALYEADVLEWSEHQGRLLRQYAAGRAGDEVPDWACIIEEVESVGRGQLSAVRSLLVRALVCDLKCSAWPLSRDVPHWRAEARGFREDAAEAFTPAMRQRIDVEALYRRALHRMPEMMDGQAALPVPGSCPVSLEELLGEV